MEVAEKPLDTETISPDLSDAEDARKKHRRRSDHGGDDDDDAKKGLVANYVSDVR
jgi:hypothetical protein